MPSDQICLITSKSIELVQIFPTTLKTKTLSKHELSVQWVKYSPITNTFVVPCAGENAVQLVLYSSNSLVKLPKLEISTMYRYWRRIKAGAQTRAILSIKEKSMWLLRLYDQAYLVHLISVNEESRLVVYLVDRQAKQLVEESFCILGSARESYAINVIDNLITVHYLQAKVTTLFDIKSVPTEHGPSISGSNQSIRGVIINVNL